MYIETESKVEDGKLTELKKLRIDGSEDELKEFAMVFMDAIAYGKAKRQVDATKIIVKLSDAAG